MDASGCVEHSGNLVEMVPCYICPSQQHSEIVCERTESGDSMRIKLLALFALAASLCILGCSDDDDSFVSDTGQQQAVNASLLLQLDFGAIPRELRLRLPDAVSLLRIEVYGPNGTLEQTVNTQRVTQIELQNLNLGRTLIRIIGLDSNGNVVGYIDRGLTVTSNTPPLIVDSLLAGEPPAPNFEIPTPGEPTRLAFLLPPSNTTTADTQAVEVVVLDGDGNRVASQTGQVNLSLLGGPTLVGPNVDNLDAGLARFDGLSVQEAATGLTLAAQLGNLTPATSLPFDVAQATDLRVNQSQSNQSEPDVDVSGAGNFVVVWSLDQGDGDEEGVFFQQFDANADPAGPATLVNLTTAGEQDSPAVGVADNGNFMVAYETPNPVHPLAGPDLTARLFDANGTP